MSHLCDNQHCGHPASAHDNGGKCCGEVTDVYGTWICLCIGFEPDPDD